MGRKVLSLLPCFHFHHHLLVVLQMLNFDVVNYIFLCHFAFSVKYCLSQSKINFIACNSYIVYMLCVLTQFVSYSGMWQIISKALEQYYLQNSIKCLGFYANCSNDGHLVGFYVMYFDLFEHARGMCYLHLQSD